MINILVKTFLRARERRLKQMREQPDALQEQWFRHLLHKASHTEWGKKYDYGSIHTPDQFRNTVPVQQYETLHPHIQRAMEGTPNVLWPGRIQWFAKSSGTTSDRSKYIPVTKEALHTCHFQGSKDCLTAYIQQVPDSQLFNGRGLIIGGSHQINHLNTQSKYGDLSAVLLQNMPFFGHWFRSPELDIALMDDWETKLEKMARATMGENITSLSGVPTWTLVLIRRIMELTGQDDLSAIWPGLELYMHGGVSFTPYREQFSSLISSSRVCYQETYNASEGFFGLQDDLRKNELLLLTNHGIFYEFIPMAEIDRAHPRTLLLHEVESGEHYALVVSTNTGLWRYKVGDTIQFTSTRPYRFHVTGRTKHFINAFGEEIIIENAEQALAVACRQTGAKIREYTAGPVYFSETHGKGGHEWLIEFTQTPDNAEAFAISLDKALKAVNSDYEAKRYKGLALQLPVIQAVPHGTFHQWLKSKGKLGGQHKVPRLSNNRKYIEEIQAFIREAALNG